ncbi:MAG TPA: GNAT family N-acetyltransferase [Xanthobacteraceae bacterium]|nr:GNAT family N-acetyltransferase [Xanthobacteraceae bacterium]
MSAQSKPPFALRPYLPADAPVLAEIFRLSIEELTGEDYNEDQQRAWAEAADDEQAFAQKLGQQLVLIATLGGEPVGFASLENNNHIDLVYVHPSVARQGVGNMLVDALEKLAGARGTQKLTVEASDNAQDFFRQRGYEAQSRNTIEMSGEWLANTTMDKKLPGKEKS